MGKKRVESNVVYPLLIPNNEIVLQLPYPPTINHYYGRNKYTGGMFIKKKGQEHRKDTQEIVSNWYVENGILPIDIPIIKKQHRIKFEVHMIVPDKRERDTDNILKCTKDSLAKADLMESDYSINDEHVVRYSNPIKPGFLLIRILPNEEIIYNG